MTRRPGPAARRALAVPALALTLALGGVACSGDDDDPGAAPNGAEGSADPGDGPSAGVVTEVTVEEVAGTLAPGREEPLLAEVGAVVDAWVDAAYLGDFPRGDFAPAFEGFTPGAAQQAAEDLALLSNQGIAEQVDTVVATNRRVRLDVFAPGGRAEGATARLVLDYDTTGDLVVSERVIGSLHLTRVRGAWRIFGYDLVKEERP